MGSIDDARLAAMFRRAIAFVTVSEHEGFCVPLVESLAFDVPVVARVRGHPRDRGGRRVLLPAWAGAELVAGAIDRIVSDLDLRRDLIARGRRRLRELTEVDASVAMLEAIGEIV